MFQIIKDPSQSMLDSLWAEVTKTAICHDCGVKPGQPHKDGCDTARCLNTGMQRLQCDCGKCGEDVWTGIWPGIKECYEKRLVCFDTATNRVCFDLNRQCVEFQLECQRKQRNEKASAA